MSLVPGQRLGPYEITAPLGAGGMGEVYRARDTRLGRDVAVKILPAEFAAQNERVARFQQEARATGALNHPNILALYDLGTHEGVPYIVSELLEGETLRERIAEGALPARKAAEYAAQAARGLAAAHDKGIVHRDLKPENLFLTGDGRIKILDFGLAKLTRPESGPGEMSSLPTTPAGTGAGVVLGTVGYMAPEQVRGRPADGRADLFALGAILYEMVSGRRAFTGESAVETMNAILKEDPPPLGGEGRAVPPALERVVLHCLEKNPGERFQSARDVAFSLEALGDSSASGAQAVPSGAMDAPGRRTRFAGIAIVALAAAAAVAAAFVAGKRLGGGASPAEVVFTPKTFTQMALYKALFAPDGKSIIFSAATSGTTPVIFIQRPEYPEPVPLAQAGIHLLSISSRGELAVLTKARWVGHRLFTGTLARMPMGGAPRELLENVREADWAPDGERLAIIRDAGGRDRLEFPPGTLLYEASGYLSDLRVSPGGDRIALFEHPSRWDDRGSLIVVDLRGHRTVLSEGNWGEEGIAWSSDGGTILFSVGTGYVDFAVHAATLSGQPRVALRSAGGVTIHDVSKDGQWLITRDDIHREVLFHAPGQATDRNLAWLDLSDVVALSGDGSTMLITEDSSAAGVNYLVAIRKTDGSAVVKLGEGAAADLSPDSRMALAGIPSDPDKLVLYPTGAGQPRTLPAGPIRNYASAAWSRDGRAIIESATESGKAPRCYLQDPAGGDPKPVTPDGTIDCQIAPDRSYVIARSPAGSYMRYPLDGSAPTPLTVLRDEDKIIQWTADRKGLLVGRAEGPLRRVDRVDPIAGTREEVRLIAPADRIGLQSVTSVAFADSLDTYAYSCFRSLSHLFLVEGVR